MPKKKFPQTIYIQNIGDDGGLITFEGLEDTDLDYPDIAVYELKKVGKRTTKVIFQ